jgi:uncharacterized protein YdaU (DUF1376 family)
MNPPACRYRRPAFLPYEGGRARIGGQFMSQPWMPFYGGDFFGNTLHLTGAEIGGYVCLIWHYWEHGSLPTDDGKLSRIARAAPGHWPRIRAALAPLFGNPELGGSWIHSRVETELARRAEISNKRKGAAQQMLNLKRANAQQMLPHSQSHIFKNSSLEEGTARERPAIGNGAHWAHVDSPQYRAWQKYRETQGKMSTPIDKQFGWNFPTEWPPT